MRRPESTRYLLIGLACLVGGVALVLWSALINTQPCSVSGNTCAVSLEAGFALFAGFMALIVAAFMLATAFWRYRSVDPRVQLRSMGLDDVATNENATPLVEPGLTYVYRRQRPPRT
jgi:hypothetical protein